MKFLTHHASRITFALVLLQLAIGSWQLAFAQSFYLTFNEPTNAAAVGVLHYDVWWQQTNAPDANQHAWFGQCPAGRTNIDIPDGQLPNPALIFATSSTSNSISAFSEPLLFDTNSFPLPPLVLPPGKMTVHRRN